MKLPYNPEDKNSILEFAKRLKGKSLREVCDETIINHGYSGKGNFGQILEKYYFLYNPNSESEPDFPIAKLELKSTPLKQLRSKEYRSKERLVLNAINYLEVVNQEFETSSFWRKNENLILIIYLHQAGFNILDYLIKLVDEWTFPNADLEIIKKDWQIIKQKIVDGKAHELSEGDTFYLGACTKGVNANSTRKQPFSDIPAKRRAYSLKQGYVNHIIASIANESLGIYGKLIPSVDVARKQTIEEIVISKFKPCLGKTGEELIKEFNLQHINTTAKNYYSIISGRIIKSILDVPLNKNVDEYLEEFNKAEIVIKTIRIETKNNIKESISFPAFQFTELYSENWITSEFKSLIEKKFLFIFFKKIGTNYIFDKIKFWNMPFNDRNEVRKVWLKTKYQIQIGNIFDDYDRDKQGNVRYTKKGNPIRFNHFPKSSENKVCHVRPHGTDSTYTFPLPVRDRKLNVDEYSKQCFWLNNTYVRDEIYLK